MAYKQPNNINQIFKIKPLIQIHTRKTTLAEIKVSQSHSRVSLFEMEDSQENTNNTIFSVRIVSIDYYMSPPLPDLDISYSSFQGSTLPLLISALF